MDSADLWSGADRAMEIIKAGLSSLESMDGTDIRKDNIGVDGEEEWSSGCEELEAEWVYFGEKFRLPLRYQLVLCLPTVSVARIIRTG
jgi:hypothetical protein